MENISVEDGEVEAEIEAIAKSSQQNSFQVRAALTKNDGKRSIAHRLRNRKALDLLVENASVTDAEWVEPKAEEEAPKDE
jgi:FKBP-type peptidyl-prolyl cis-trans isomerase (trigger factor)